VPAPLPHSEPTDRSPSERRVHPGHRAQPTYPAGVRGVTSESDAFAEALESIKGLQPRPEFHVEEAPAPQRLAPEALALTAELWDDQDEEVASGRFVLLHDPDGTDEWEGTFRAVVFVRAPLEPDLAGDPLLADVGWSWLVDALAAAGAEATQLGGTVTRTCGASFGTMVDRATEASIEIRASWTPVPTPEAAGQMDRHAAAWLALLEMAAGIVPVPREVTRVHSGRQRTRG
jgi:hypothetical protein